jgi:pimeloyl-ACP methyl ester carboxylesterase
MHTRLYDYFVANARPLPALALLLTGCHSPGMGPCILFRLGEIARCGTLRVYENRARNSGRQIDLRVIVLPARGRQVAPDPIVWLTGGPGLAAGEDAIGVAKLFSSLRVHHDIVLVDQRGTGRSSPLDCPRSADSRLQASFDPLFSADKARACRRRLERRADLTQYTTAAAMDDLADVLTALGYSSADLIGGSYGTRAALVFLRRHPDRVRRVVLDGVSPPDQRLFSATPRATARELAVIDSSHVVDSAARRLPVTLTLWNWRRLRHETVTITPRAFAERMFFLLYVPSRGRRAVRLLRQALAGDWAPFATLALFESRTRIAGRYRGMSLSVLCTEDAPRLTRADTALPIVNELLAACSEWPRGALAPDDTMRVTGSAPVLLISGGLDPATPPELADSAALGLPNSTTFVDSTAGHAMFYDNQVARLTSFIDR